jgi:salicylate 5-hydroxylase small subunit
MSSLAAPPLAAAPTAHAEPAAPTARVRPTCSAEDWLAICALYADYAAALDARELDRWPGFFTEDCIYKLQSRENFDRGWPLATLAFESRGMLQDRVYAAKDTLFHDPYHQRHIVGLPRLLARTVTGWRIEASLLVMRTRRDCMPEPLFVGRTLDHVVQSPDGLLFAERLCIFDNDLLPNSIVDPI